MVSPQRILPASFRHVENETPSGVIDGANVVFMTEFKFFAEHVSVYLNGLRLRPGLSNDYIVTSDQSFSMNYAPLPGDQIWVDYYRSK